MEGGGHERERAARVGVGDQRPRRHALRPGQSLRRQDGGGAARVTFELTLVTTAVLLAIAVLFDDRVVPRTREGIAALVAIAWISNAAGPGLLAIAIGPLPAVFTTLVIFLEAIAAAAVGWMILGERLTFVQGLGGALILLGIWAARPREGSARP